MRLAVQVQEKGHPLTRWTALNSTLFGQVWDPEALANTSEAALQHKHKLTPYRDQALAGRVVSTFVRGQQVFAEGSVLSPDPCGSTLLRDNL